MVESLYERKAMYDSEKIILQARISSGKPRVLANQLASLETAEVGVQIAEQGKGRTIRAAEGAGESECLKALGAAAVNLHCIRGRRIVFVLFFCT